VICRSRSPATQGRGGLHLVTDPVCVGVPTRDGPKTDVHPPSHRRCSGQARPPELRVVATPKMARRPVRLRAPQVRAAGIDTEEAVVRSRRPTWFAVFRVRLRVEAAPEQNGGMTRLNMCTLCRVCTYVSWFRLRFAGVNRLTPGGISHSHFDGERAQPRPCKRLRAPGFAKEMRQSRGGDGAARILTGVALAKQIPAPAGRGSAAAPPA
jgi:hypothetical protein